MYIPDSIQKLINSHRKDTARLEREKNQPQIQVSKAGSFLAVLYEKIRNSVDYEEEHLLRKRAIKRIMLRMAALKGGNAEELATNIVKEIILGQYLTEFPTPVGKIKITADILSKYHALNREFKNIFGRKMSKEMAEKLYSLAAFEIERTLVPYNHRDHLVNAQYKFINDLGILSEDKLPKEYESLQNYIACHRANVKSDEGMIEFHLFFFKFPFWSQPSYDQIRLVAQNMSQVLKEIDDHRKYKVKKKRYNEVVRQSIPFKILNKVILRNLNNAEEVIQDKKMLLEEVDKVCANEYRDNKRRLRTTIVRSIIYIFITKIIFALIIEVPYELFIAEYINYRNLAINIVFPSLTMFIVANSFSIPSRKNTETIKEMILAILSKDKTDDRIAFAHHSGVGDVFRIIFKLFYFILFFAIFGGIVYFLFLLNFSLPGMLIFVIFFSTIFFVAAKLRRTASELRVVSKRASVFAPIIDMFATPILFLGKKLSEGASQINIFTIVLDFIIEAPFKTIVKVFEDWNTYIRETREEIV